MNRIQSVLLSSLATRTAVILTKSDPKALITCKRPELNLYQLQQSQAKFNSIPLASSAWRNRKSKGDYFIIHSQRTEYDNEWGQEFSQFEALSKQLVKNLLDSGLKRSTWIQNEVIPSMLKNNHILIAGKQ